jgi:starvation-inducible outer membrane lipoprotein
MRHTRPLSLSGIVAMCAAGAFVLAGCAAPPAAVDPETTATPSPTVEPVRRPRTYRARARRTFGGDGARSNSTARI